MRNDQEFTPKYWVAHWGCGDDVLLFTAAKTLFESQKLFNAYVFNLGLDDEDIETVRFDLIEIKLVIK